MQAMQFLKVKAERDAGGDGAGRTKTFFIEIGRALKFHWMRCIFALMLTTGYVLWLPFSSIEAFLASPSSLMWLQIQLLQ
jgi:hypothetical protein